MTVQVQHEITHDGPYLRVVLPEVVPPDWEAVRRNVRFEIDEPVTRATVVAPHPRGDAEAHELRRLGYLIARSGAEVIFQWHDEASVEQVTGPIRIPVPSFRLTTRP